MANSGILAQQARELRAFLATCPDPRAGAARRVALARESGQLRCAMRSVACRRSARIRVVEWHRNRKTRSELAEELGIAQDLIASAIRRRGIYKCPSPENREKNLRERRALMQRLKERALL